MLVYDDEHFKRQALREAQNAFREDEVPIGAVLVINNEIIARVHNQAEH
jgi:tRNA(adenine34) deaminase